MSQLLYVHKRRPHTHWIRGWTWTLWWREKSLAFTRNQTHPQYYPRFHHCSKTTITCRYPLLNMNTCHPIALSWIWITSAFISKMDFLYKYFICLYNTMRYLYFFFLQCFGIVTVFTKKSMYHLGALKHSSQEAGMVALGTAWLKSINQSSWLTHWLSISAIFIHSCQYILWAQFQQHWIPKCKEIMRWCLLSILTLNSDSCKEIWRLYCNLLNKWCNFLSCFYSINMRQTF